MSIVGRIAWLLKHALHNIVLIVAFVVSLVASVLLNLNLPATRRFAAHITTFLLKDLFQGKIVLEKVDSISLGGVRGARVRILDDTGQTVAYADGINASAPVLGLVRSILVGPGDMRIEITHVYVDSADVNLDYNGDDMRLARAFVIKPDPKAKPSTPSTRGVHVELPEIVVRHAWAHGSIAGQPPIDADADAVFAQLSVQSSATTQPIDDVHVNVGRGHLKSRAAPYNANVDGDAHVTIDIPLTEQPMALSGGYHGDVAEMPAKAKFKLDGKKIDATVDVPRVDFAHVQKIVPGAPLADLAAAHAEVHGTLDDMQATAHTEFGKGTVDAKADIKTTDGVDIAGTFDVAHVDARAFVATAPKTDVNASGKATIASKNGAFSGTYDVDVAKGTVADQATPTAKIKGTLSQTAIAANVRVDEPGAPTTANAKLDLGKNKLTFATQTDSPGLEGIPQLKRMVHGRAAVSTQGTIDLTKKTIDASFDVHGGRLSANGVTARTIEADGSVTGALASPSIVANVHGKDVLAPGDMKVETVDGGAKIDIGSSVTVRDADVDFSTAGEHIKVHADRIRTDAGIKVDGATIDGLGELVGVDVEQQNGLLAASVHAHNVDLSKVGRIVGVQQIQGLASINADVRLTHAEAKGSVSVDVRRASIGPLDRATAHLDATLLGRGVIANVHFDSPDLGRIDVNTSTIQLAGSPLQPKSWEEATGAAQIDGEVALSKVLPYLPPGTLTQLDGTLIIDGEIQRNDPHAVPAVEIEASTKQLLVVKAPSFKSDDIDVAVVAKIDGKGRAEVDARLVDPKGDLLTLATTADLPVDQLVTLHVPMQTLMKVPLTADLEIPERKFAAMPKAVGVSHIQGKVQATLKASGTALDPKFELAAHVMNFRTPDLPISMATSADVGVTYDGKLAELNGVMLAKKKTVLQLDAKANVLWRDFMIMGPKPTLPWDASAHAVLFGLPLQSLQPLNDRGIKGSASGEVSIVDLHKNASASVQVSVDSLKVGKAKYTNTFVRGTLGADGTMNAAVRLDQSDGYASATLNGGMKWGNAYAPTVDPTKSWVASLDADNVSLGVALPFVDNYLNQLDGRVDAKVRATIPPTGTPSVDGQIALRDGIVQSPAVGEEFHDVSTTVKLAPSGTDTIITADKITLFGTTGKVMASASARFHGVEFGGANLVATIPKDMPIQLTAEGQDYGEGYGDINVQVTKPNALLTSVAVKIPSFHVNVPEVSTRALQDLDPAETVRIGVRRGDGTFVPLALGGTADPVAPNKSELDVDIQMEKDVDVKVGDMVKVQLSGGPHIAVKETTVITGQIQLRGGTLDVQGKQFEIQDGSTVTFNGGDPGNPDIVVSALWPAPDGTRVFADFNGPLKTGKVTLRSEPAKSQNDILALILFGSADESGAQNQSEGGGIQAATAAGGFATQGLNKAIGDLTGLDATVRIDTSEANNPKPE
ncbi:MAG TPA: translocation/assembly module TamB domain-containing protein, partial [Polyangiaceae bacterium]